MDGPMRDTEQIHDSWDKNSKEGHSSDWESSDSGKQDHGKRWCQKHACSDTCFQWDFAFEIKCQDEKMPWWSKHVPNLISDPWRRGRDGLDVNLEEDLEYQGKFSANSSESLKKRCGEMPWSFKYLPIEFPPVRDRTSFGNVQGQDMYSSVEFGHGSNREENGTCQFQFGFKHKETPCFMRMFIPCNRRVSEDENSSTNSRAGDQSN